MQSSLRFSRRRRRTGASVLAAVVACACAGVGSASSEANASPAADKPSGRARAERSAQVQPAAAEPAAAQANASLQQDPGEAAYLIGPGDRLRLFVWKEPELTQEIAVRVDGVITVPLIGDVRAAGVTTSQLSSVIQEKLGRFVNTPSVTVGVIAPQSAQFFVTGRVTRPGAYPLDKPITFLQALALAGGFTEFAKTDHVLVFRAGQPQPIPVNYKKLEEGGDVRGNLVLRTGDTIVVP